jgi:hypothetical protein
VNNVKLACGCYGEWNGERWQVAASSFLCDHKQGDPVDGAPPMAGQPDLLNVAKHHAPGVVHQYLVETVAALAEAQGERDEALKSLEAIDGIEQALAWALDSLELCFKRLDAVDTYSPEHLAIRAAGLAKARAALEGAPE